MAALNFPTTGLVAGVTQYTSDLGTTYIWDGVKWVGHSAGGSVGTNSIANNGHTVQVNADGELILPAYTLPNTEGTIDQVLTWPQIGTVLEWRDQTGTNGTTLPADAAGYLINDGGGNLSWVAGDGTGLSVSDFGEGFSLTAANKIVTNTLYSTNESQPNQHYRLELTTGGTIKLPDQSEILGSTLKGIYGTGEANYTGITIGPTAQNSEESWMYVDHNGAYIATQYNTDQKLWTFDSNGVLTIPDAGIKFADGSYIKSQDEEGLILWQTDDQTANNSEYIGLWYGGDPDGDSPNVSITSGSYNWAIDDERLEYFNYPDQVADQGLRQINLDIRLDNGNILNWHLDTSGNLYLPADPAVSSVSGIVFGDGTVQTTAATGGGNANTGNFTFDADTITNDNGLTLQTDRGTLAIGTNMETPGVAQHFHIAFDGSNSMPSSNDLFLGDDYNYFKLPGTLQDDFGAEIGTNDRDGGDSHVWRFETDGNLVLPQGSTISDQATSVDLTVDHTSDNPFWYNLFGDTGATGNNYANVAINGSVVHDSGGNVYVLGSTIDWNNGLGSNNLFLKYSPEGNLLWRRTWTDDAGMDCGSYNASLRYIEANIDLGTQDTIVWAAQVPWNRISYIGTMDTEGNLVDQYGNARLPTRLDNFAVTDLVWTGNIDQVGDSTVGVVGQQYLPGPGYHFPAFAGVDLANAAVFSNTTIMPDGTNLNYGDQNSQPNYVNQFKAVTTIPAWNGNPAVGAFVGTYYDGDYSHAMIAVSGEGTELFQIGQGTDDNIGEDICCDANGNVYVIVNNINSNYAVLSKVNIGALFATQDSVWQIQLGFDPITGPDRFYATAVAYDNGYVYVLGQYYDAGTGDTDAMIIKVGIGNGDVVWQRRIGSPGDDGVSFFGGAGWDSSSGISVYDNLIAISFATEARTPGINNGPPELNTVTLQYPTDGSILGTFGDFVISDFDIGSIPADYGITTLTTSLGGEPVTDGFAALQATTAAVGTGWTNTQWDLENNREIFDSQTFKFNSDGTFDTKEIKHLGEVRITAAVAPNVVEPTPATWVFQNNEGLRFPDGSVQYGAYVETETALDGGSAVTVFNIIPRPTVADGGGSSSRHGVADPVYDGSSGNDYVLDGGGA